jgi:hypothetical protein
VSKEKSLEIRMRRTLDRRGYRLKKSARRDRLAPDYGKFWIIDSSDDSVVYEAADLPAVVAWVENMRA